jgi:DNA modification methylase
MILAGHGFIEGARLAGLTHVWATQFSHLTETQKRGYLIADNKIAEQAGWDREMLAIEFGELIDLLPVEGFDVSVTGFETTEIDLLIADMAASRNEPSETVPPPPRTAATKLGDLWHLGKHKLLCGDAQDAANLTRLMNGTLATAIFCDPPYNLSAGLLGWRGRIRHPDFAFASGEMSPDQYRRFLNRTLGNLVQVSAEGAVHFICMDWRHIEDLIAVSRKLYGAMLNLVVWNKTNAGQGSFYRSQHELIGVFRVGDHTHKNNIDLGRFGRNRSNVWTYAGANTFGRGRMEALAAHPTVKPTALVADALLDCTARGDAVLDGFAGSGPIFLAAEKVGRTAYGLEIEPRYVDAAIMRWQHMTKLAATLEGDGRTFEEIQQVRAKRQNPPQVVANSTPGRIATAATKTSSKIQTRARPRRAKP